MKQLELKYPQNHHDLMHENQDGDSIIWEPGRQCSHKKWHKIGRNQVLPSDFANAVNVFETVNEFNGWRLIRLLKSIRANFIEIDSPHDVSDQYDYADLLLAVLDTISGKCWPWPDVCIDSARGPHLYWLYPPISPDELCRWRLMQNALYELLKQFGADKRSLDPCRLLRMAGTIHGKTGKFITGRIIDPTEEPRSYNQLAEILLKERPSSKPKAKVRGLEAERARQGKTPSKNRNITNKKNAGHKHISSWWFKVYRDLMTIMDYHWFGGVPEGYRDQILFLIAVSLSWFTGQETLEEEIIATARTWMPTFKNKQVKEYCSCILKRAALAADDKKFEWKNDKGEIELRDPRYSFKSETLYAWMEDLIPDELMPELRTILPREVLDDRKKVNGRKYDAIHDPIRKPKQRREVGMKPHKGEEVKLEAKKLADQGMTQGEISRILDVPQRTISRWLEKIIINQ